MFAQKVAFNFKQPGVLKITMLDEDNEKLSRISYRINLSGKKHTIAGEDAVKSPFKVNLLPGNYDLHVYRNLSRYNGSKKTRWISAPSWGRTSNRLIEVSG